FYIVQARKPLMPSESSGKNGNCCCARKLRLGLAVLTVGLIPAFSPLKTFAQAAPAAPTAAQASPSSFQGSVTVGEASAQPIDLTLDDAIQRGLKNNLGVIL